MTSNVTIIVGESQEKIVELALVLDQAGFSVDTVLPDDAGASSSYLLIRNGTEWERGIDYLLKSRSDLLKGVYVLTSRLVNPDAALYRDETIHLPFDLLRALAVHVIRDQAKKP